MLHFMEEDAEDSINWDQKIWENMYLYKVFIKMAYKIFQALPTIWQLNILNISYNALKSKIHCFS